MAVTRYYSFGGEILGEDTGGTRRDYLTDALGNVIATVTSAGAIENTYRYKPYGETLVKTGTGSDPKFLWNGKWGYFSEGHGVYIRNRYYSKSTGRWYSKDKINIDGYNYYIYVHGNTINYIDYNGLRAAIPCCCCAEDISWKKGKSNDWGYQLINEITIISKYSMHLIDNSKKEKAGDCDIEWWEKATDTILMDLQQPQDEWNEQISLVKNSQFTSPTLDGWFNRTKNCPGKNEAQMKDSPALRYPNRAGVNKIEIRCFDIVLKSASECNCKKQKVNLRLVQKAVAKNGKLDGKESGIKELKGNEEKYCER